MKVATYILCIFILFVPIIIGSEGDWTEKYPELWQSRLYIILTKGFDEESMRTYSNSSLRFISDSKNIEKVQAVLEDDGKLPFDLYSILIETLHPGFAELSKDYYKEQRNSSGVPKMFNEFDAKFYKKLDALNHLFYTGIKWDTFKGLPSKEEVMCEAAYFYDLIDFERAITCLDAVPPTPLICKAFSNFVADMYYGEAEREDFSYEGDVETREWLNNMFKKYERSWHRYTSSLMRRFTRNIKGKVDERLWTNYMRAMMTVHLSAVLLEIKVGDLKYLYDYIADNNIQDEYMFASRELDPLQPGETVRGAHAFLRTFKFNPISETATMGIINSGDGIESHDSKSFDLSELPDTISSVPHAESVDRYIPFVVYDAVPERDWGPACTVVDSMDKAYFEHNQRKYIFGGYRRWQYIDNQRAGTCSAMSLWVALYWFERESQQRLESFRLTLYLEVLKEASKELHRLRTELEELDTQRPESVDDEPKWNELQSIINEKSETEDDFLRFFSVAFNSAIRSIRYLHTDPFEQGLNMTSIMQDYADFYESQAGEKYWQLVKPNIDDLYTSTYNRILNPTRSLPSIAPKISTKERDCVNEVNQTIKAKDPFNFVKAVISGTDLKCQSKSFIASIHFGVDGLDLQTHHEDLILRALAKEILSLRGGRLSIIRLVHKLTNDYGFKLFPIYDVPSTESIDFTENIYQVVLLEDDTGMKQFAANCTAFDLLGKNVLEAAYDLIPTRKSLKRLDTEVEVDDTEEYKLHESLVQHVADELQSMDPHIHSQYLGNLIKDAEETGIAAHICLFKPSEGWNSDDYALLERAAKGNGSDKDSIKEYFDKFHSLFVGRESASKHSPTLPSNLSDDEYIYVGAISRAINANSPLKFVKAIAFGALKRCRNEVFFSYIIRGTSTLKLQPYHQHLILQTFLRHNNALEMLEFIDKLITEHNFKLILTDDTPPEKMTPIRTLLVFYIKIISMENGIDAKKFAAHANADKSPANIILGLCTEHSDLAELRQRFVNHILKELKEMDQHARINHLDKLVSQGVLKGDEFASF